MAMKWSDGNEMNSSVMKILHLQLCTTVHLHRCLLLAGTVVWRLRLTVGVDRLHLLLAVGVDRLHLLLAVRIVLDHLHDWCRVLNVYDGVGGRLPLQ